MNHSPIRLAAESVGRVQRWWETSDLKQRIQQLLPLERHPEADSSEPAAPSSSVIASPNPIREYHRPSLSSQTGPTSEDLERIERGSIPSLIDDPELASGASSFSSVEEEEMLRATGDDELVVVETDIGHEMATRMLHNATTDS